MRAVRGELSDHARTSRARNILIGIQITASALLLIYAAIFLRGALASATLKPGIRTSDTVIIEVANEPLREVTVQAVKADPAVTTTVRVTGESGEARRLMLQVAFWRAVAYLGSLAGIVAAGAAIRGKIVIL